MTTRSANHKKYLTDLTRTVSAFIRALDAEMKQPSTKGWLKKAMGRA